MDYKTIGQPTKIHNMSFYNCDCMDLLRETPDNYYDLAICDPPYGIGVGGTVGGGKPFGKGGRGEIITPKSYRGFDDSKPPEQKYFQELQRISKNQIIWGGNYFIEFLQNTSCFVVWDKDNSGNFADCELAWTSFKTAVRKYKYRWNGMLQQEMGFNKEDRIHPTQKPVALYKWLLKNYAKEGDKILDTHLGSGSIGIACHYMGFNLTGCELDKEYFYSAMERIKNQTTQQTLL